MVGPDPSELLSVVSRRAPLLEAIRRGIYDKRDLEHELGISRSTINRAFAELVESGVLSERPNGYQFTYVGEFCYQMYVELTENYERFIEARTLLSELPPEAPLDVAVLKGARIHLAERPAPQKPIQYLENRVREATTIKGVSSIVLPVLTRTLDDALDARDLSVEFVLDERTIAYLVAEHRRCVVGALETNACRIWQIEREPPFCAFVVDDEEMWLGSYDGLGNVTGAIVNETDAAIEWALDAFREYRDDASRCRPSDENVLHVH